MFGVSSGFSVANHRRGFGLLNAEVGEGDIDIAHVDVDHAVAREGGGLAAMLPADSPCRTMYNNSGQICDISKGTEDCELKAPRIGYFQCAMRTQRTLRTDGTLSTGQQNITGHCTQ